MRKLLVIFLLCGLATTAAAQEPLWKAPIDPANPVRVTAESGKESAVWTTPCDVLQPAKLYRFEFHARRAGGSGSVVAGPECVNRDYADVGPEWTWYSHCFRTPDNLPKSVNMRFGQWQGSETIECDAMRVVEVVPIQKKCGDLNTFLTALGTGESFDANGFHFNATFDGEGANYHQLLAYATAYFNSNRWCFGNDSQVVYAMSAFLPGENEVSRKAKVEINVNYRTEGVCAVEAALGDPAKLAELTDANWVKLGEVDAVRTVTFDLPESLVNQTKTSASQNSPNQILLRLRGVPTAGGNSANFQVDRIQMDLLSDKSLENVEHSTGQTLYGEVIPPSPESLAKADLTELDKVVQSASDRTFEWVNLSGDFVFWCHVPQKGIDVNVSTVVEAIPDGQIHETTVNFGRTLQLKVPLYTPTYYRTDYGTGLTADDTANVWWCDATQKVPKNRKAAEVKPGTRESVQLQACRGDREAAQLIVYANGRTTAADGTITFTPGKYPENLNGMTATMGDLVGLEHPDAKIDAQNVSLSWVRYHWVEHPTDATCVRDWWPDALVPMRPIDCPFGENQPLWIEIAVPRGIPADTYTGTVTVKAKAGGENAPRDWQTQIPVQIKVWNFDLPEEPMLESGYGLSPTWIYAYHNITSETDKRAVLDLYLQALSENRICVYNPVPLDGFSVKFIVDGKNSRAKFDFSKWDAAMERAFEKYHCKNFSLPIQGMGGGTFQSRTEPSLEGFGEDTPEYQAMFQSYVTQLEAHLIEKGWIDRAYVYWFDEPEPKDYAFVQKGMERIKKYAPRIRTMLTEEPGSPEFADCVDLWCPISNMFNQEKADTQMDKGQKFWWYVCCGPKAPYCTEFTDHPATELRIWFWQAWQRKITGSLIWHTNWWTSDTAFPNGYQDPYADPMCYTSGYGIEPGTKAFWGNGDGRFLYPPEECNVPGAAKNADGSPRAVVAPPVRSIRLAMIREGSDDYEYLAILRDRIATARAKLAAGE
ncbi:MAG: DUF4091 domain-containing protein, partial [Thermoguttaceae bacterium]|nr:DUF4091 domain-containing protein [Thermoguttaceae bacterium]